MSSSAGVAAPGDELVLGTGSLNGVDGYGVGAEEGYTDEPGAGEGDSKMPRISAMAEADLEARFLEAICRPRKAARGLKIQ